MGCAASFVTPQLYVGTQLSLSHVSTGSSQAAIAFIYEGERVLVPSFEIAEEVLRHFGAEEAHIAWLRRLLNPR